MNSESFVIEFDYIEQSRRRAVVEIWRPAGESPKDWSFHSLNILPSPRNERPARVRCLNNFEWRTGMPKRAVPVTVVLNWQADLKR